MSITNPIPVNNALSLLWIGVCNIYDYVEITDPETFQTTSQLIQVLSDEPCRLSHSKFEVTKLDGSIAGIEEKIKLFIRPDIEVKAGSVIEVTQHGKTNTYKRSGEPAIYTNHQEINLELDKLV